MDWLKKTAGKVKHAHSDRRHSHRPSSANSNDPHVQTGRFENADSPACCALGGRLDGTFGDDDAAWKLKSAWKSVSDYWRHFDADSEAAGGGDDLHDATGAGAQTHLPQNTDESDRLLLAYLHLFNNRYAPLEYAVGSVDMCAIQPGPSIPPTSPVGFGVVSPASVRSPLDSSLAGHPHAAVTGICCLARRMVGRFEHSVHRNEQSTSNIAEALLAHIEILSRYPGDREALIKHEVPPALVDMLKIATPVLHTGNTEDTHTQMHAWRCIQSILITLQRCSDPDGQWARYVRNPTQLDTGAFQGSSPMRLRPQIMLSHSIIRAAVYSVNGLLIALYAHLQPSNSAVRIQCINTLACLCSRHSSTVASIYEELRKSGELCSLQLNFPSLAEYPFASEGAEAKWASLAGILKADVLTLNYVDYASRQNLVPRHLLVNEFWENGTMSLLMWTAAIYNGETALEAESPLFADMHLLGGGQGERSALEALCSPATKLVVSAIVTLALIQYHRGPQFAPASPFPNSPKLYSPRIHSPSGSDYFASQGAEATSWRSLLEQFENLLRNSGVSGAEKVPQLAGAQNGASSALQFAVIYTLHSLLDEESFGERARELRRKDILGVMEDLRLWNHFSQKAFFGGIPKEGLYEPQKSNAARSLQNAILEFLRFSATLTEWPNDGPCQALLTLLTDTAATDDVAFAQTCDTLCRTLHDRCEATQEALIRLRIFDTLIPLISNLRAQGKHSLLSSIITLLRSVLDGSSAITIDVFTNPAAMSLLFDMLAQETVAVSSFAQTVILNMPPILIREYPTYQQRTLSIVSDLQLASLGGDQETTSDLLKRYFERFPSVITRAEEAEYQLRLLLGVRKLVQNNPECASALKKSLVKAKAHQVLLSVLSVKIDLGDAAKETQEKLIHALAESVVRTLVVIMRNDHSAKKTFRLLRGYDELLTRICIKPKAFAWSELISELFILVADGDTSWPPRLHNGDAVNLLFRTYEYCSPELRRRFVTKLKEVSRAHGANTALLHNTGAFSQILKLVLPLVTDAGDLDDIMSLLKGIASYSLTVAEVKLLLQCLRRRDLANMPPTGKTAPIWASSFAGYKPMTSQIESAADHENAINTAELPFWYDALLRMVLDISREQDGDLDFYAFDGSRGMRMPGVKKWPSGATGWSFIAWVKFDAFDDGGRTASSDPSIFCLQSASAEQRLEIFVKDGALCVAVTRQGKTHVVSTLEAALTPGNWHCIVVCQSFPKMPWSTHAEAAIYVDGAAIWKGKQEFPETGAYITASLGCSAGDEQSARSSTTGRTSLRVERALTGQMTSVYLLDDVLLPQQTSAIYLLGPAFASSLTRQRSGRIPDEPSPVLDMGKIILEFHPLATKTIPLQDESGAIVAYPSSHHERVSDSDIGVDQVGRPAGGVITCRTKCFQTGIHALGGVGILIPILAQVDLHGGADVYTEEANDDLNAAELRRRNIRKRRTSSFFDLMSSVMTRDAVHRDTFFAIKGPKIVASLLQQNDPANLGSDVFEALIRFVEALSSNHELAAAVEETLIFDPQLWTQTSTLVQLEYLCLIRSLLSTGFDKYRMRFGIQFWVGVLERWYGNIDAKLASSDSGDAPVAKLSGGDLMQLRLVVIDILRDFLKYTPTAGDVEQLLHTFTIDDEEHISQCLSATLEIVVSHPQNKLLDCMLQHGGAETIFHLLSVASSEKITVLALQMLSAMFISDRVPDKWKKRLKLEDVSKLKMSGGVASAPGPCLFSRIMAHGELTMSIYHGLLQLAYEEEILDWTTQETVLVPIDMRSAKIQNAGFIQAILQMAADRDVPIPLKCEVIHDLIVLSCRQGNGSKMRKSSRWPASFLQLLTTEAAYDSSGKSAAPHPGEGVEPSVEASVEAFKLKHLIYEALTTFTLDNFEKDKKSWRCIEDIVIYAWLTKSEKEAHGIICDFLVCLLSAVRGEIAAGNFRTLSHAKMENISHAILFVEEFMFCHQNMRAALLEAVRAQDQERLSQLPCSPDVLGTNSAQAQTSEPDAVHASFPWTECRPLAEECLEVLSCFLDAGVIFVKLEDNAEKSHIRSGGFLRVAIRILLSGLSLLEEEIWHLVLRHLIPLMDKHAVTFSEGKKEKGLYVLGHVHEAFIIAQNRSSDIQRVDYRVLLPLYMLVVNRWRELIGGLTDKSTGGGESIISDILLNEALMDQDIFLHLVSSPVWDGVFESHFFPVMRSVEDEQFAMVPFIAKRFGKATRTILSAWQKDEANLEVTTKAFLAKLQEEAWKMKENEVRARHELERSMEMERRWRTRELCSLWRNLTQERGIWRPYSELDPSATPTRPWKLDRAENSLRMRRRLAVNWEFDDHDSAAAKRDKTYKIQSSRAGSPKMVRSNTNSSLSGTLKRSGSVPMAGPGDGGDLLSQMNLTDSAAFILDDELDMAEEEWNVLNEDDLQGMSSTIGLDGLGLEGGQRLIFSTECDMILLMTPVKGRLELTATHLIFTADIKSTTADLCEAEREAVITLMTDNRAWLKERAWPLEDLTDCYLRRYMLRRSALELFFVDKTNHLFNFRGTGKAASKERQKFLKCLVNCKPGRLKTVDLKSTPQDIAKRSNMTDRWIKREISNFEYLMWLNTVSGRTYNDLTQYPVFPWVLRDFSSDSLDLGDPSVYRDLSKPIGAIDDNRLQQFLERYHSFEDPTGRIKKFHYGTHYSSAASVLYYLLRLEPLTSLHISLQSGKFDHPDRQFHSMQSCWKSVSTGAGDVKELIPEFFYMPEFLLNENDFDLGVKQTGEVLGDVILPPWAKTVDDFIRIHREALESDYVSSHLNEWIDLIWGYKQTGDEAIKANNVFYYLTYEGAINIDAIEDPVERRSIEDQINNFGQTPSQLFKKPHPRRSPAVKANNSHLFTNPQDYRSYIIETPRGPEIQFIAACGDGRGDGSAGGADKSRSSAAGGAASEGRIITVDKSLHFRSHKWRSPLDGSLSCDMDRSPLITRELPLDPASSLQLHSNLFAVTKDGRHLFAGGSWDCSFKVIQLENPQGPSTTARTVETIYGHRDIVTCIAISADENIVATGSRDTTVLTWELESTAQAVGVKKLRPKVFCGHDEWVTDVALDTEHGIVASGSTDGTVILHTLYDAGYLRSLRPCPEKPEEVLSIRRVLITQNACIVVYSEVTPRENTVTVAPQTGAKELYPDTPPSGSESTHMSPTQRRTSMVPALGGVCYLHVFSVNGRLMQSRMFPTRSKDVKCSSDGEHLVIADDRGGISLLSLHSLQVLHRFDVSITITGAWISHDQRHFFFGRKDGRLLLLEHDKRVARSDSFSSR